MKIAVCIKPVKTALVYENDNRVEDFVMNPYDLYALIQCTQLKKEKDYEVIAMCMGPSGSEDFLRKALAMGADEAILLNDNAFIASDTVATSYIMAQAIKKIQDVDAVICGKRTIDGETGHVVYALSERLGVPFVTNVHKVLDIAEDTITVEQVCEEKEVTMSVQAPIVIGCFDFTTTMPTINLLAIKKAKRKSITVWSASDLALDLNKCGAGGSKTKVISATPQMIKKANQILEGTLSEKVTLVHDLIKQIQ